LDIEAQPERKKARPRVRPRTERKERIRIMIFKPLEKVISPEPTGASLVSEKKDFLLYT